MSSSRRSPPTRRVIDVLDHLLAHPDQQFGLSELSRAVGISKPTCLGIATTLTELGWVRRDDGSRTYATGPALVAAGSRARSQMPGLADAEPHLVALANKYGTTCTASAVIGEEIVVLASVRPDGSSAGPGAGARYPFAPPVGLMYVIWDSDEAFERWLARTPRSRSRWSGIIYAQWSPNVVIVAT